MDILEQLRTRLHQLLLRKELPAHQVMRSSVFIENASSIGILFDASKQEDRDRVMAFAKQLKGKGKQVDILGYFDNKLKASDFPFPHFDKKQLDWALRPKASGVKTFAGRPFDLLINLSNRPALPLDYIAALSMAKFRVGPYTENTFSYDLMIEHDEQKGLGVFLNQVLHYLGNMQSDLEVAAI